MILFDLFYQSGKINFKLNRKKIMKSSMMKSL